MKRVSIAISLILMMFGCSSIEFPYTTSDKEASMSYHLGKRITVASMSTNQQGVPYEQINNYDIPSYLLAHTGRIISSKTIKDQNIVADVSSETVEEERTMNEQGLLQSRSAVVSHSHKLEIDGLGKHTFGQAVIISKDGYFLTAAHVVDSGQSLLLFNLPDPESSRILPAVLPFRTVLKDDRGDLAIIKADINVPHHIDLHEGKPVIGELLFAGGWGDFGNGGVGSGRLQRKYRRQNPSRKGLSIIHWATSIPILPGDSGSGAISEDGELRGIVIQLAGIESIIATMDTETIRNAIEADRNGRHKE